MYHESESSFLVRLEIAWPTPYSFYNLTSASVWISSKLASHCWHHEYIFLWQAQTFMESAHEKRHLGISYFCVVDIFTFFIRIFIIYRVGSELTRGVTS
jgi:hypothetical protein